ncbi:MAG TPA: DUF559 domain-containing protein [Dongiaceae bacterium]|jgi:very-short-patch-repair endonuclease|nr:DUF559 domain-containing protein [Dongiaceae bacterium]
MNETFTTEREERFHTLWEEISDEAAGMELEYEQSAKAERRKIIRRYYKIALPGIMQLAETKPLVWFQKYPFNWKFNENEDALWGKIAWRPMVMYPEFPVLSYFVDFGNPFLKIAIEADSEEFHDKEKDTERDLKLLEAGWKTFRVSYEENSAPFKEFGEIAEMFDNGNESEALEEMENWMLKTSDGVVEAIEFFYFKCPEERERIMNKFPNYFSLAERTLQRHRYVDFELPNLF